MWLTTIYGLDWPSKPASNEEEVKIQQKELCSLLDRLQAANFNMVFLQVRARGDVAYRSEIEPASKVFSGKYGIMPAYDPLTYAIEECHKRGMECHAWFVTFPVGTNQTVREQGNSSVVRRLPQLCKRHKGEWYLDPGEPGTADYLQSLVSELVGNYDIDGIHFDYIRYPDEAESFPDRSLYNKSGKSMSLADWRRDNINRIVYRLYDEVKRLKPWVQVSSSPLGKYNRIERRPDAGWTAYETVFQDPVRWIEEGKHDMIAPMMYYQDDDFYPFVDDWQENSNGRLVVPGLGAYRMDRREADWKLKDITVQIEYLREQDASGAAFFRTEHVLDNRKKFYDELKDNYFKSPAMLPPLDWLSDSRPIAPNEVFVERVGDELHLSWNKMEDEETEKITYTLYYSLTNSINYSSSEHILLAKTEGNTFILPITPETEQGYFFSITASNRYRNESLPSQETFYYQSEYAK